MPNWCDNEILITAQYETITALLRKAEAPATPEDETESRFSFLPFVEDFLPEKTDDSISYSEVLGCKWFPEDVSIEFSGNSLLLTFLTPWRPSNQATRHLAVWLRQLDPSCTLVHCYEEAGVGFCGLLTIDENGENERQGDLIGLDCSQEPLDEKQVQEVVSVFEVTPEDLQIYAMDFDEYLYFYPSFFKGYCGFENAICLEPRDE